MAPSSLAAAAALLLLLSTSSSSYAQQVGNQQAENHPPLTTYTCQADGSCSPTSGTSIVLDQNWRWIHNVGGSTNCYTGDEWDSSLCPDPVSCASNCALDGANYEGVYGVTTNGDSMSIKLVTVGQYDTNIGARLYLLQDDHTYQQFRLKNREFTFDVDTSTQGCGINGALYFVDMDAGG